MDGPARRNLERNKTVHSSLARASLPVVIMVVVLATTNVAAAMKARGEELVRLTATSFASSDPDVAGRPLPGLTPAGQLSGTAIPMSQLNGTPTAMAWPNSPVPTPTLLIDLNFCPGLGSRIPEAAFADATADPEKIAGYGQTCSPNRPPGPDNPLRNVLGLRNPNRPYHPLFNSLAWQCGCR